MFKLKNPSLQKGFTLPELMVSVTLFLTVIFISMGSVLQVFDANRKSRSLKTVMSNLNLSLEGMSKEIRYGYTYHCGSSGQVTAAQNCPGGDTYLTFMSSDGVQTYYRLNANAIEKRLGNGDFLPVTAPEVTIQGLDFYVLGAGTDNALQPKVNILVRGQAGAGAEATNFTLQTLVSQRKRDNP